MENIDRKIVSSTRALCSDTIQKANSGQPGLPLGGASAAYVLWGRIMNHTPNQKEWINRDRVILSAGQVQPC